MIIKIIIISRQIIDQSSQSSFNPTAHNFTYSMVSIAWADSVKSGPNTRLTHNIDNKTPKYKECNQITSSMRILMIPKELM